MNGIAAVVIVTFNSAEYIVACLESVYRHTPGAEVVVVDNDSEDGSPEIVAQRFPNARLIRNSTNEGFASGVNTGVEASSEDVLLLLNPDAELQDGTVEALVDALSDPEIAIVGCKVLKPDGRVLQHVGGIVHANALTDHLGRDELDEGQYDHVQDVAYVTAAALGVRRETWERLGGFDRGYWPAYYEELELCWRARADGYRVVVVPEATVHHHEGRASTKSGNLHRDPPNRFYRIYHRNRIRFVLRNFPVRQLLCRFLPAELRWLAEVRPRNQWVALCAAYARGLWTLPSVAVLRLRKKCTRRWASLADTVLAK